MVVGALGERTDVVVIGSGPGGYVAALRAADAGREVTLIERDTVGGTCLNVGCIPSKALIEVASSYRSLRDGAGRGLTGDVRVDMGLVSEHLTSVTRGLRSGVESLLADAGVTMIAGSAYFARRDRLSIEHEDRVTHLEFEDAIVATGSRPIELPKFGLNERLVDSTGALALQHIPTTMAIIGGGYIGIELGIAFAKLGSHVSIIEATSTVLPGLAPELRRPVERRLRTLGVAVMAARRAHAPHAKGVELESGDIVEAEIVVVAVGRRPNSDTCGLNATGATVTDRGHVEVDQDQLAAPHVYAIGDLTQGTALAHRATADAERAVAHLVGAPIPPPVAIPEVIFSDPEIMSVGITLAQAERLGATVHRFPHGASARAHTMGASSGATYIVADDQQTVLGVHAVGPHVSELAGEATLAVEMAATLTDLAMTVHPHPTMSESIAEAALVGRGHPLHVRQPAQPGR